MKQGKLWLILVLVLLTFGGLACSDDSDDTTTTDDDDDTTDDDDDTTDDDDDTTDDDDDTTDDDDDTTDDDDDTTDDDDDDTDDDDDDTDDDDDDDTAECSGHGTLANGMCFCERGYMVDPANQGDCIVYQHQDGVPVLLKAFMHAPAATKVYFSTMSVIGTIEASDYDLYVSHLDGPTLEIGDHVQAVNLGNTQSFDEVTELPEDGYAADGDEMVIGISYRTGGAGETGYTMSENIYGLKIDDGEGNATYAKIEVLMAQNGEVRIMAYWQPDGSRNVSTTTPAE